MKLTCPHCNSKFTLEESSRTQVLDEMADVAATLGNMWQPALEYTNAFATVRFGIMAPEKRLRIIKEFAKLWQNQVFEYAGKRYRTSGQKIEAAVKTVCDVEKSGFKNHNYLKKILLADAEMVSAEGLTAREENQRDKKRKRARVLDETDAEPQCMDMDEMRRITEKNFRKNRR